MLQPIVRRALLMALWICSYLLLYMTVGATQPIEQSAPPPLDRSSEGHSTACWAPILSRLILPW
jgi:hypothetical protein